MASLLKIYGPQIIPKRQHTFPTETFPLVQPAPLFKSAEEATAATWLHLGCRSHISAWGVTLWGSDEAQDIVKAEHSTFIYFFTMAAPKDSLGGSPLLLSPNQPCKSHFKPTPQGLRQLLPFPSSTKTLSPLKMKNQNMPTPKRNIQVSRWFISEFNGWGNRVSRDAVNSATSTQV